MSRTRIPFLVVGVAGLLAMATWAADPVIPTAESIFVYDSSGRTTFRGAPLAVGDVIDAYDPSGVRCGTLTVGAPGIFGALPVYRDDSTTKDRDEGAQFGEEIRFEINGEPAVVTSGGPVQWTANGDTKDIVLTVPGLPAPPEPPPSAGSLILVEGFEGDLPGWTAGADVPADPNQPGQTVAWHVLPSTVRAYAGQRSLELWLDGRQDDGTVWLMRQITPSPKPGSAVRLSLRFYSPYLGSMNNLAYVVAYVGGQPPTREADFVRLAPVNQVGKWDLLTHTGVAPSTPSPVWVAVGFSLIWETAQTYYLDDLVVEAEPDGATPVRSSTWGALKTPGP